MGGSAGGPAESRRLNEGRFIDEAKLGETRQREAVALDDGGGGADARGLLDATARSGGAAAGEAGVETVARVGTASADLLLLPLRLAPLLLPPAAPLPKNSRLNEERLLRTPSAAPDCG